MKTKLLAGLALGMGLAMAGPADAQIRIGVGGPITGPNASFGAQLRHGVEQAVEDINAAGGILGQRLVLSVGDDVSDPRQGVSVANKFVGDGVKFVIGHFNSGVSIPASEVYAENGVLAISPASTNPRLTERGLWNVFRTCGRDDQQGAVAGAYLARQFAGKRVAIVHDKTTYGKGLADETQRVMNAAGLKEVLYEAVNTGEKDFSALISKLKAANIDVVYWGGLHTEGGLIVRQMRDQGLNAPMMSGDGIADNEFAAIAGPGAVGTLMTFPPDPRNRPEARQIVDKFRTARRFDPQAYTLYSYAAVQILQQAAVAANSLDPKKIADFMRTGHVFKTVIGDISYDKKGDITRADYVTYTWRPGPDGRVTYLENTGTN
ncbi:branched-chain amino acid ABC transporter substrate-binding protein [Phreatobacter sp.]|uniref:branched-chain amino acid ABC transporter substrate-binding protein n=1 Tax=Phreatobacter sp. TaxID=1966341 RepID=UPI003F724027